MSHDYEIAEIRARIRKAESDHDAWRRAGNQEKYIASYFLIEALEAELDRVRKRNLELGS